MGVNRENVVCPLTLTHTIPCSVTVISFSIQYLYAVVTVLNVLTEMQTAVTDVSHRVSV